MDIQHFGLVWDLRFTSFHYLHIYHRWWKLERWHCSFIQLKTFLESIICRRRHGLWLGDVWRNCAISLSGPILVFKKEKASFWLSMFFWAWLSLYVDLISSGNLSSGIGHLGNCGHIFEKVLFWKMLNKREYVIDCIPFFHLSFISCSTMKSHLWSTEIFGNIKKGLLFESQWVLPSRIECIPICKDLLWFRPK